jgi:deoxyribodipyrimidine photo-lyase
VRTIVWFRQDLRLADNPALTHAAAQGEVVPVFIWAPEEEGDWPPGAASRWWLHHSLAALDADLRQRGSRLVIRRGPTADTLCTLLGETGSDRVVWNRRYEPAAITRDAAVKREIERTRSFNGALLREPWTMPGRGGDGYRVFTPYWRALQSGGVPEPPLPAPAVPASGAWPESLEIGALGLLPSIPWDTGLSAVWEPGERGAGARLGAFLERAAAYGAQRDRPALPSSELSPHLHHGELSPRQVWHAVSEAAGAAAEPFLRQLAWREFAHHLLYHVPETATEPLRPDFRAMPWRDDPAELRTWQRGRTGFGLVDAGMRQLWASGWMHNRARLVTASFLTKDLLIHWHAGARWFWDTLVDADLANNTLGWQWVAGSGADAAPFFRVFNPAVQAERFDPDGRYQDRWLAGDRTDEMLAHESARRRALAAYDAVRRG